MKIVLCYNHQFSNLSSRKPINNSFRGNLDDRLANLEKELSQTKKTKKEDKDNFEKQLITNEKKIRDIDNDIEYKTNTNYSRTKEIKNLSGEKNKKDKEIQELQQVNNNLDQDLKNAEMQSSNYEKKKKNLLEKIEQDRANAQIKMQTTIEEQTKKIQESFHSEIQKVLNNAKTVLNQRVLTPVELEKRGKETIVPGGILIESESNEHSKRIFEWITKKTDSNFSLIDAASYEDKSDLYNMIVSISQKAKKEFEKNQKRTFTFIDNFEHCAFPTEENFAIIGSLKGFLDTCSSVDHNTIVVSTTDQSNLDHIVSNHHRFQVKVKIDEDFLNDKKFGFNSIFNELIELKSTGKELKMSSFELLIKNMKKIIK